MTIRTIDPAAENFVQVCARILADASRRSAAAAQVKVVRKPKRKATAHRAAK